MAENSPPKPRNGMARAAKHIVQRSPRFWRKKRSHDIDPQQGSPLFALLPQELRDQIWQLALEPPAKAKATHFHIYDEVYDSCTHRHHTPETTTAGPRSSPTQIALLLTCRRIHDEALHYLWDQNLFTFVVSAGQPRGHSLGRPDVCKNLGKLRNCEELFRRIRSLVIVVQPGKNPHVELYMERIQELLRVLEYGKHLCNLTLIFNYRIEIRMFDPMHIKPRQITEAFYPLKAHILPNIEAGRCHFTILYSRIERSTIPNDAGHYSQYEGAMEVITGVLVRPTRYPLPGFQPPRPLKPGSRARPGDQKTRIGAFNLRKEGMSDRLENFGADGGCVLRGAYGKDNVALQPLQPLGQTPAKIPYLPGIKQEHIFAAAMVATGLALWPITVPVGVYAVVRHKRRKGEWR